MENKESLWAKRVNVVKLKKRSISDVAMDKCDSWGGKTMLKIMDSIKEHDDAVIADMVVNGFDPLARVDTAYSYKKITSGGDISQLSFLIGITSGDTLKGVLGGYTVNAESGFGTEVHESIRVNNVVVGYIALHLVKLHDTSSIRSNRYQDLVPQTEYSGNNDVPASIVDWIFSMKDLP
ncbi:hypothetical protein Tco_0710175 [Tanacetum coccineum]